MQRFGTTRAAAAAAAAGGSASAAALLASLSSRPPAAAVAARLICSPVAAYASQCRAHAAASMMPPARATISSSVHRLSPRAAATARTAPLCSTRSLAGLAYTAVSPARFISPVANARPTRQPLRCANRPAARRLSAASAFSREGHEVDEHAPGFVTLTLSRPAVHNAFSDASIRALSCTLDELRHRHELRALFIRAQGRSFCAGADLEWMRRASTYSKEESHADALELTGMLYKLATMPCATVAIVQGDAFGGGVGLISACDVAVGLRGTNFALSEAKLGLIPATISPYVVRRIGGSQARRYFLTAERFTAERALQLGLLHEVAEDAEELEAWAERLTQSLRACAPTAVASGKELVKLVEDHPISEHLLDETAKLLAVQRTSEEGREGVNAFLEKRRPSWAVRA